MADGEYLTKDVKLEYFLGVPVCLLCALELSTT
jgi:hypothetical protein